MLGCESIKSAMESNVLNLLPFTNQRSTGIEIGKMAYGTGDIPFIRTSDISNWELKNDPKQNISEEIYGANQQRC